VQKWLLCVSESVPNFSYLDVTLQHVDIAWSFTRVDYLNKLDVIGTTLRNFKSPRKLACGHCGPLLSFNSLCVS
jgi:hypothetical protein